MREKEFNLEFATSSDAIVKLTLWTGLAILTLITLMMLYVLTLRYRLFIGDRHRKALIEVWRPLLIHSLVSIAESLPPIKEKDWPVLLNLWIHFHEELKGKVKENLNKIARGTGMRDVAVRMLKTKRIKERLVAIEVLGLLRDKSEWQEIKRIAMGEHPSLSRAAAMAMMRIDDDEAMPFIMFLIGSRIEWPISQVAGILLEAKPEIVCSALENAVLNSPVAHIPRLVRYLGTISRHSNLSVLRQVMNKHPTDAVIAACLQALNNPDDLDLARKHITHTAWYVRLQAVRALGRMGILQDKFILIDMLNDSQWWVRYRAAQALAGLPFVGMDDLEQIKQENRDRYARDILAQVIAEKRMH